MMLHTKYNGVGPCGFRQYFYFYICCKKLYKTKGHNLNKLGKVALGDATTLLILFYAFPIKAYVKHVAPRMGPFWQHGHNFNKPGGGVY